jgi:hypothetical protein
VFFPKRLLQLLLGALLGGIKSFAALHACSGRGVRGRKGPYRSCLLRLCSIIRRRIAACIAVTSAGVIGGRVSGSFVILGFFLRRGFWAFCRCCSRCCVRFCARRYDSKSLCLRSYSEATSEPILGGGTFGLACGLGFGFLRFGRSCACFLGAGADSALDGVDRRPNPNMRDRNPMPRIRARAPKDGKLPGDLLGRLLSEQHRTRRNRHRRHNLAE